MDFVLMIILGIFALFIIGGITVLVLWIVSKGKGKITIQLYKREYALGETIKGKITLNLKKPVEATALNVGLIAEKRVRSYSSRGSSTSTQIVFDFKKPVDNSGNYSLGERTYDFDLQIPADAIPEQNGVMNAISMVGSVLGGAGSIRWYVTSNLDMKGWDLSQKVQINVVSGQPSHAIS